MCFKKRIRWALKPTNIEERMIKMNALKETVEKLRETGSIGLEDFRSLKIKDVEVLTEEIKQWCLYGNGKPEKLGKKHKEH
jgi:hypothetical protein